MQISQIFQSIPQPHPGFNQRFDDIFKGFVNKTQDFIQNAHDIDRQAQAYLEGQSDIAQLAPTMSQFLLKVEAAKAITEGFINTWKTLQNTSA